MGNYVGLSKSALERVAETRKHYPDLMKLKGARLERVAKAAIASFVREGAPVRSNPYDDKHRRIVVEIR